MKQAHKISPRAFNKLVLLLFATILNPGLAQKALASLSCSNTHTSAGVMNFTETLPRGSTLVGSTNMNGMILATRRGEVYIYNKVNEEAGTLWIWGRVRLNPGETIRGFDPNGHLIIVNRQGLIFKQTPSSARGQTGERYLFDHANLNPGEYVAGIANTNQIIIADSSGNIFQQTRDGKRWHRGSVPLLPGEFVAGYYGVTNQVVISNPQGVVKIHTTASSDGSLWGWGTISALNN